MHGRAGSRHVSLRDKVVVITGASSGIGRVAALQFAREGCRVVLAARREASLREVAALCEDHGGAARRGHGYDLRSRRATAGR